ncbi:EAL domain-containing protein [uncultured Sphingomonas sp.]|uniref:EAL domain-containing protein n=1 Tax=uncultured Sphingomonas sp. TaxID=158754 RepID=UPI0035CC0443
MPAAPRGERLQALALVQIVEFGALRRRHGPDVADALVLEAAERIAAALPDATVAAIGRNLIELGLVAADIAELEDRLAPLRTPFDSGTIGRSCRLTLTLGVAAAPLSSADAVELVEAAERALAAARRGKPEVMPAPEIILHATDESVLRDELRQAIVRDELFVQYQPKLHLRRRAITSVEALIRWTHPRRGLVLPSDFIPAAERSGEIGPMTLWTLRRVIADQRVLARNGHELPIFINIAGVLLSDSDFVDAAAALIEASGASIGFEITETSVIREPEAAIRNLQRLADLGVAITIDDYGAGLSSLAYLKQLPASELKIDKLFVTQLSSSHRDPLIVRSTIDLAHALEMEVVAEGVETSTSLALLSVMGCDLVQGFLISRPVALETLLVYLREERYNSLFNEARSPLDRLAAVRAQA